MPSPYETYLRRYLNDNGQLWTSGQIERWAGRAINEICRVYPSFHIRERLNIEEGVPLYTIPIAGHNYPNLGISQITYKGTVIFPLNQQQARDMFPEYVVTDYEAASGGAFEPTAFEPTAFYVSDSTGFETVSGSRGRPVYWAYSGYNENTIQLFPTPNEDVSNSVTGDAWSADIPLKCIVEYRTVQIDGSNTTQPHYRLIRQLIKDYVLSQAFSIEGPGQQIKEAVMLQSRFRAKLDLYKALASNVHVANKHKMSDQRQQFYQFPKRINFGSDIGRRVR